MPVHSFGTIIEVSLEEGLAKLGDVVSMDGPQTQVTASPTHHLRSDGAWKTKVPGLCDPGQINMTMRWGGFATSGAFPGTNQETFYFTRLYRKMRAWKLTAPDGTVIDFRGFCVSWQPSFPDDDTCNVDVTIELSGPITVTPGAPVAQVTTFPFTLTP